MSNATSGFFLVLVAATALAAVACSSSDIAVGSTDSALQRKKDGSPTGNGTTCGWDTSVSSPDSGPTTPTPSGPYKIGDKFPSLDGCNQCSCTADGISCTEMACAPDSRACRYAGKSYASGATFPSGDGCNTCSCAEGGVSCTMRGCAPTCPDTSNYCKDLCAGLPTPAIPAGCSGPKCSTCPR